MYVQCFTVRFTYIVVLTIKLNPFIITRNVGGSAIKVIFRTVNFKSQKVNYTSNMEAIQGLLKFKMFPPLFVVLWGFIMLMLIPGLMTKTKSFLGVPGPLHHIQGYQNFSEICFHPYQSTCKIGKQSNRNILSKKYEIVNKLGVLGVFIIYMLISWVQVSEKDDLITVETCTRKKNN